MTFGSTPQNPYEKTQDPKHRAPQNFSHSVAFWRLNQFRNYRCGSSLSAKLSVFESYEYGNRTVSETWDFQPDFKRKKGSKGPPTAVAEYGHGLHPRLRNLFGCDWIRRFQSVWYGYIQV